MEIRKPNFIVSLIFLSESERAGFSLLFLLWMGKIKLFFADNGKFSIIAKQLGD